MCCDQVRYVCVFCACVLGVRVGDGALEYLVAAMTGGKMLQSGGVQAVIVLRFAAGTLFILALVLRGVGAAHTNILVAVP